MATTATSSPEPQQQQHQPKQHNNQTEETTKEAASSKRASKAKTSSNSSIVYDVEHLATFSTNGSDDNTNNRLTSGASDENVAGKAKFPGGDARLSETTLQRQSNSAPTKTTPKVALQRLFELEKLSGIWTQHMQIELRNDFMLIVDCETDSVVERFNRECVTKPEAFNQYNDIYNNILVFIIRQEEEKQGGSNGPAESKRNKSKEDGDEGELHIFQCVSHDAQQLVSDILAWKSTHNKSSSLQTSVSCSVSDSDQKMANSRGGKQAAPTKQQDKKSPSAREQESSASERIKSDQAASNKKDSSLDKPVVTVASSAKSTGEQVPIVNVNVKETVQVFNQIAALREKSKPSSPIAGHNARPLSDASLASSSQSAGQQSASAAAAAGDAESAAASQPSTANGGQPAHQLYKQRSIRATLAPKFSPSSASASETAPSQQASSSASSNGANSLASSEQLPAHKAHAPSRPGEQLQRHQRNSHSAQYQHHHKGASNGAPKQRSAELQLQQQQHRLSQSDSSRSQASTSSSSHQSQVDQVTTNESYVSVLNHCFDDIEKFIIRLQQAATGQAALSELQLAAKRSSKSHSKKMLAGSSQRDLQAPGAPSATELAMLTARALGPAEEDYFEILSKFKLAFNLLAKLKGCIHEPNAPELVHFLFTPLAIIIDSARNATPSIDPTLVGIPYLNQDALDLLSNCCTSKESDMWISLGPNWTQTIDMSLLKASRLPSSFQPIFSDGWAPIIGELELIGLVAAPQQAAHQQLANECLSAAPSNGELKDTNNNHNGTAEAHHGARHHHHRHHRSAASRSTAASAPDAAGEIVPAVPLAPLEPHSVYSPSGVASNGMSKSGSRKKGSLAPPGGAARRLYQQHDHLTSPQLEPLDGRQQQQQPYKPVPYGYMAEAQPPRVAGLGPPSRRVRPPHTGAAASGALQYQQQSELGYTYKEPHYPNMSMADSSHMFPEDELDEESELNARLHYQRAVNGAGHLNPMLHSDDYTELHHDDPYLAPTLINEPLHAKGANHHHHRHQPAAQHGNYQPRKHRSADKMSKASSESRKAALQQPHSMLMAHGAEPDDYLLSESEHEAMLMDLGPAQAEWFYELQARGALIVRVLFTREANNDKELSVQRGELLEILDDTRKWWRARNIELQVAHVPHTIVAVMQGYQTLDELLANQPNGDLEEPSLMASTATSSGKAYSSSRSREHLHQLPLNHQLHHHHHNQHQPPALPLPMSVQDNFNHSQHWRSVNEAKRASSTAKTSGAFRYF